MPKELESIQHLKIQREDYSGLVSNRLDFVGNLGKEKLKGADFPVVVGILNTRKKVDQIFSGYPSRIQEIDKELKAYEDAKRYIELTDLGAGQIRQLKAEGYLSEKDQKIIGII